VANSRSIMHRVAPIMTVIRGSIGTDPDLAAQWRTNEGQRRTAYRALAQILADRGTLKPGLTVEEAAELAFLIESVENYFLATATLGWSPARWQRTMISLLATTLLAPTPANRLPGSREVDHDPPPDL
jgi:hypothetical protein